jgi:hypothetical protein
MLVEFEILDFLISMADSEDESLVLEALGAGNECCTLRTSLTEPGQL